MNAVSFGANPERMSPRQSAVEVASSRKLIGGHAILNGSNVLVGQYGEPVTRYSVNSNKLQQAAQAKATDDLRKLIGDHRDMVSPNPTPEQQERSQTIIDQGGLSLENGGHTAMQESASALDQAAIMQDIDRIHSQSNN
jgi:hypothetical protein